MLKRRASDDFSDPESNGVDELGQKEDSKGASKKRPDDRSY